MSLADLGITPDEPPSDDRRRRGAFLWAFGSLAAAIAAGAAVVLIVTGLGHAPGPAPLPPTDFALAPSAVPDPVTGAPPVVKSTPTAGNGHVVPAAARQDGSRSDSSAAGATVRKQTPPGPVDNDTLVIPAVGIDAHVGRSGVANGELVLPSDVRETTEWDGSAAIDSASGTILIAGHVDNVNQGAGALHELHQVRAGDAVYLTRNGVVTRWKIIAVQSVLKAELPADLFVGESGPRLLKLVTCGGAVVHDSEGRGSYVDNVVVTAVPF